MLTTCDACAKAKAKAKGVTKKASEPASKPGEWLYFDSMAVLYITGWIYLLGDGC